MSFVISDLNIDSRRQVTIDSRRLIDILYDFIFAPLREIKKFNELIELTMIEIKKGISISGDELYFTASRSSGPGGQNVNKVGTRVTVLFNVTNCESFADEEKRQILKRLATRINKEGVLRVVSQRFRTQKANREAATERLIELLRCALEKKPVRRKTKVPLRVKQSRLENKKRRGILKRQRAALD